MILHIARHADWERAQSQDQYRAPSLEREGFIHCSTPGQVVATANRLFHGERGLVLLRIDEARVGSPVKVEAGGFPHVYGPIPKAAVLDAIPWERSEGAGFVLPARAGVSLFSRIIRGELPSYKLHEDEWTFSLLTRDAIQLGHSLIVPKVEVDHFSDVPEPYYSAVFRNARRLSHAIRKATGCGRVGAMIAGWEVPHFHLHLIPTNGLSDFDFSKGRVRSAEDNARMQEAIARELGRG